MRGGREERIERLVDRAASTIFAASTGLSLFMLLAGATQRAAIAAASVVVAYFVAFRSLRALNGRGTAYAVPIFVLPDVEFEDAGELLLTEQVELLLTEADILRPSKSNEDELILDDILDKLGHGSRVVRLFDPDAMPSPAQLNRRIEQHLHHRAPPAAPSDDSKALYDALTQLRRSLR